jgi:CheY-like chemotaxis protein
VVARIICVDDKPENLLVRKLLLEQFGCDVTAVSDGPTGLRAFEEKSFDLALIDYHLTREMDGEQLARAVRAQYPKTPLIMLTGDPRIPDSARESVDVVLLKGATGPRDLLEIIQALIPGATLSSVLPDILLPPKAH